jgi:formamidopyrimidine-DNA glycosylase
VPARIGTATARTWTPGRGDRQTRGVPELPEVEALADHLRRHAVGLTVGRVDVAALSVLKTFDPPVSALYGQAVTGANRWAKYLGLEVGDLHLITHLSRAGWLRWSDKLAAAPLKPGKGPIALRVHLGTPGDAPGPNVAAGAAPGPNVAAGAAPGFDLTEAGTQKRLAVWLVDDPAKVPGIATLGPDALALGPDDLASALKGNSGRIKTVITDQKVIAGIGNAYSDEILHVAKLSPFATAGKLTDAQLAALHDAMISVLSDAVSRSVGQQAATLKGEKRSGLRVHARTGLPCPVCGDTVREVSFADKSFQYCATCQTGGKVLADRRMSKLLK